MSRTPARRRYPIGAEILGDGTAHVRVWAPARKRVEVQLYPAVVHPFHRPDWIHSPFDATRKSYDPAAAQDAWARAVRFIRENGAKA